MSQGPIAIGGFSAQGESQSVIKGVPTSGRIPNGAIVEREINFDLVELNSVKSSLRNPDFTTARRMAVAINKLIGEPAARPTDPATIMLAIPAKYQGDTVALLTDIEQLRVKVDQIARVVIDEKPGVIVMGENVRISTVGRRPRQPHHPDHRNPPGQPAPRLSRPRVRPRPCRARTSTSRREMGASSPSCPRASPFRNWSTA